MTSDGNGWYSYNIYGYDSARVIFSDNGSIRIPDKTNQVIPLSEKNGM